MQLLLSPPAMRMRTACAVALLMLCATAVFARSASAYPVPGTAAPTTTCQPGHLCLYMHSNYRVKILDLVATWKGRGEWSVPSNLASSWVNLTMDTFRAEDHQPVWGTPFKRWVSLGSMPSQSWNPLVPARVNDRLDRVVRPN